MSRILLPRRLPPGGTIGVAAISGAVDAERLDRGLTHLRSLGYRIREASNLRSTWRDFAGTDEARADGYRRLLADRDVDAIFFARGGWGAARILRMLDPGEMRDNPKIQMGGSDLTSLLAFVNSAGVVGFHGPMVAVEMARNPIDPSTDSAWRQLLAGDAVSSEFDSSQVLRDGVAGGPLVGGCLSLVVSVLGTPEAIPLEGAVLFLEDVHEEVYRIDRMLTQLRRSGGLDRLAGAIIGSFSGVTRHGIDDPRSLEDVLADHFGSAPYPVVTRWPAGHGTPNKALALGARISLDTRRRIVSYEEGAVW